MEVTSEKELKKICIGLNVFKAKNRLKLLYPSLSDKIDLEFVESNAQRFTVIDCKYDKSQKKLTLKATSNNPIRHLPSMYQDNDFLRNYLMIFQHIMNETSITLDNIDNLFRPMEADAKFLPVIADWFGINPELLGSEEITRKVLQFAIPLYRYRGTKLGLKTLLYLISGIKPEIIEGKLPFEPLGIGFESTIESPILEKDSDANLFSVYFPVYLEDVDKDLVKRLFKIIQTEKPVNSIGYMYFKDHFVQKRKTTVITQDIENMGTDGIQF